MNCLTCKHVLDLPKPEVGKNTFFSCNASGCKHSGCGGNHLYRYGKGRVVRCDCNDEKIVDCKAYIKR